MTNVLNVPQNNTAYQNVFIKANNGAIVSWSAKFMNSDIKKNLESTMKKKT